MSWIPHTVADFFPKPTRSSRLCNSVTNNRPDIDDLVPEFSGYGVRRVNCTGFNGNAVQDAVCEWL